MTIAARNIETLKTFEDGVWADLEAGDNPRYCTGHAVKRFRELMLIELAALVPARDFEKCAARASEQLQEPE